MYASYALDYLRLAGVLFHPAHGRRLTNYQFWSIPAINCARVSTLTGLVGEPLCSHAFFRRYLRSVEYGYNCSSIDLNCVKIIYCVAFRCMPPLSGLVILDVSHTGQMSARPATRRNEQKHEICWPNNSIDMTSIEAHTQTQNSEINNNNNSKKCPPNKIMPAWSHQDLLP